MSKIIRRVLAVLIVTGWAGSASAASMPPVAVNGLQWLQPLDFVSYDWNSISTVCNSTTGVCAGSLGGNDLTGWTWASVDDVNALFNHYIGTSELGPGPSQAGVVPASDWLEMMLADGFQITTTLVATGIAGKLRTTFQSNPGFSYYGEVYNFRPSESFPYGSFAVTDRTIPKDFAFVDFGRGAWLYRDPNATEVPIPATLALVGLGLCALGITGRKRTLCT